MCVCVFDIQLWKFQVHKVKVLPRPWSLPIRNSRSCLQELILQFIHVSGKYEANANGLGLRITAGLAFVTFMHRLKNKLERDVEGQ